MKTNKSNETQKTENRNPIVEALTHNKLCVDLRKRIVSALEKVETAKAVLFDALEKIVISMGVKPDSADDQAARKKGVNAFIRAAYADGMKPDVLEVYLSAFWKAQGYTTQNSGNKTDKRAKPRKGQGTAKDAVPEAETEDILDFSNERTRMEHFRSIVLSLKAEKVAQAALIECIRNVYR